MDPSKPRKSPTESSGLQFDGGDGDYIVYVDERGGYIYIYTSHYVQVKVGAPGEAFLRHRVARCAIADKMAPGKWKKFYEGAWLQPGVGGKASYVNAFNVTFNTSIKKYLSFNYLSGISYCDDLSKQDWSPSFHVGDVWGINGIWGYWVTNAEKNNTAVSSDSAYVYRFWQSQAGRRFRLDIGSGETPAKLGFTPPAVLLKMATSLLQAMSLDAGQSYGHAPFFESSDLIEARRARRVDCTSTEVKYQGKWTDSDGGTKKQSDEVGASLEFNFTGADIYWRAMRGPNHGLAEVNLDGLSQGTVDLWASTPNDLQFAFIKRGLAAGPHTIKVVVKGAKGPLSSGTVIQHVLFEYAADIWHASDCFTSIQGKNQWRYQQDQGGTIYALAFQEPNWKGTDGVEVGFFHLTAIPTASAVRTWTAPHDGTVRIEGTTTLDKPDQIGVVATITKSGTELWTTRLSGPATPTASHDTTVAVRTGEILTFAVKAAEADQDAKSIPRRVLWDPVVTYVEPK